MDANSSFIELSTLIGKQGTLATAGLRITVFIRDVKVAYGKLRFQVEPAAGTGLAWVENVQDVKLNQETNDQAR